MKWNLRKHLPLWIAALTLASCGQGGSNLPSANHPVQEEEEHLVTNCLHDVHVTKTVHPFVTNGSTSYQIVIPDNKYAADAASFIQNQVRSATGASLSIVVYDGEMTVNSDSTCIILGVDELSAQLGVAKTDKMLDVTGYQIKTVGRAVAVYVNHNYGFQQVAITLLRHLIGYSRYSEAMTVYTKKGDILPDMDIVERPDFQIRTQGNMASSAYSYETGFLPVNTVFYSSPGIKFVHNVFDWVNPKTYREEHPGWFSNDNKQLCYTAHGDQEEFSAMVDVIFDKMVDALAYKPECTRFSITIEDNTSVCTCPACLASKEKYGSESAALVQFMNAIDDKVQAYLQEAADIAGTAKRKIQLVFFAYYAMEKPPVKLVDGKYVPTAPEVVPNDNVSVYIAPIRANFTRNFYSEENVSSRETIEGWSAICKEINYWLYETNYSCYLYPYNSFSSTSETYRYCLGNNATYMFNEGQHNQPAVTGFGRFKEYYNQIAEFDVNTPYVQIKKDFFENYFREASVPMLRYFDELQEYMSHMHREYYADIPGTIYDRVNQSRYWPMQLLDKWLGYLDEANELIADYRYSNPDLFEILQDNLLLESIFLRYAKMTLHEGKINQRTLREMRISFLDDCARLGVTHTSESGLIDDLKSSWEL